MAKEKIPKLVTFDFSMKEHQKAYNSLISYDKMKYHSFSNYIVACINAFEDNQEQPIGNINYNKLKIETNDEKLDLILEKIDQLKNDIQNVNNIKAYQETEIRTIKPNILESSEKQIIEENHPIASGVEVEEPEEIEEADDDENISSISDLYSGLSLD